MERVATIKKELLKYGLKITSVKFLNAGSSKNNYIVKIGHKKHILKLFNKAGKNKIQKQINLMRKINKVDVLTINPLHSKVLLFGDKVGYIYSFIEGKPFSELKLKNKQYIFGKIVGRFNRATKNMASTKRNSSYITIMNNKAKDAILNFNETDSLLFKKAKKLLGLGTKIIDEKYSGYKFRTQLIHCDLHENNVFCKNGKYIIIDLEDLQNTILAREITVHSSNIITNSMKKYKKDLQEYFSGYESEYKLTKKEKELIPILLLIRKFGEIRYTINQGNKNILSKKECNSFLNYAIKRLDLMIKNYEEMEKIFREL